MKYYVEFIEGGYYDFALLTIEEHEEVYKGRFADLGIEENDPNYTNKLDEFFEAELGIAPDEWEIG